MSILDQIKVGWNAFKSNEANRMDQEYTTGPSSYYSPQRSRVSYQSERSIVASVYTRIGIDVSGIGIRHVRLDDRGRYKEDVKSKLNDCLTFQPNIDQAPRQFRQDIATTLFNEGVAVIVPTDTTTNPDKNNRFDVVSMRVGHVVEWYPKKVKVNLYNESTGVTEDIIVAKNSVAIIENPLYSVMNEPNSTLQRLTRKLQILDAVDADSGKLDLIIQLPYVIKSDARKEQAESRRKDIEFQLKGSQYGIAYTDGTEKITQLNRPAENNLLEQITTLSEMLYDELGITKEVLAGTATEEIMINYHARTVQPILDAIVEAMVRSFVRRSGIRRKERIHYFKEPFKLTPLDKIAIVADKFARNEIFTANEIRSFMGIAPSREAKADELTNSNMPQPNASGPQNPAGPTMDEMDSLMNEVFDGLSADIDKLTEGLE